MNRVALYIKKNTNQKNHPKKPPGLVPPPVECLHRNVSSMSRNNLRKSCNRCFQVEVLSHLSAESELVPMKVFENGTTTIKCIWRRPRDKASEFSGGPSVSSIRRWKHIEEKIWQRVQRKSCKFGICRSERLNRARRSQL